MKVVGILCFFVLSTTNNNKHCYDIHVTRRLRETGSRTDETGVGGTTQSLCRHRRRSENSEYDAAKEAQAHLEDKINRLKLTIAEAKIVDTSRLSHDAVQILSKVEMTNLTTKAKMTYTIVSENEANLREGKISIKTPIAQGLLNKKVGDEVEIKIPRGSIHLRIDNISVG